MIVKMDGLCFRNMIDYGIRNLMKHRDTINKLNVFPVPDGDTGTNMVTTVSKGLVGVEGSPDLSRTSKKFASTVVFEARGNSGVILSQFLKGFSEHLSDFEVADSSQMIEALQHGVDCAYSAVAHPVEGTMLTVLKDATHAVEREHDEAKSINEVITSFVAHAKTSLDNTPELLPTLKEAGVVDSGGAGVVYLFEGMKMYLDGDDLELAETEVPESAAIDYTAFDRTSTFDYGYCTELLIQLLDGREEFDYPKFKETLSSMGDSVVTTFDNDKVRIHIHTPYPEMIFAFCHKYGEFLSLKVENMTVQHTETVKKVLTSHNKSSAAFSIVAVANDRSMQKLFLEMGADAVIFDDDNVSIKDYVEAFDAVECDKIVVFPNSSDAMLSAIQAKNMYERASVHIINSRGVAECYASLPTVDFEEEDVEQVVDSLTQTISNLYVASVTHKKSESGEEYISFTGKRILATDRDLKTTVVKTVKKTLKELPKEIITIFHTARIGSDQIEAIIEGISSLDVYVEVFTVPTERLPCDLTISFE